MFWRWLNLSLTPLFQINHLYLLPCSVSPTCRIYLLVDFIYLHLSCVVISVVYVRLHIFTHCFLSPAVPQKSIFTQDSLRSSSTHFRFHKLLDFTYRVIPGIRNHGFGPSQRVSKHTLMQSETQPVSVVSINH